MLSPDGQAAVTVVPGVHMHRDHGTLSTRLGSLTDSGKHRNVLRSSTASLPSQYIAQYET